MKSINRLLHPIILVLMLNIFETSISADARSQIEFSTNESDQASSQDDSHKLAGDAPSTCWIDSDRDTKVVLLCIHGLGLHKGTFEAFGKRLARDGVALYAIDIRGFGEWKNLARSQIDFPGSLQDVNIALKMIHAKHPQLPVVILGESMGGAIALHAAAMFPDLISGLVSSVPAGDRFGQTEGEFKVGLHAILNGFHSEMNVGQGVVEQATKKDDLRATWENDPLGRMQLSPKELMDFQSFMNKNSTNAAGIKNMPVLFIQGMNDKLVRPAGTWKLYDALATPQKELVFSKSAEHLIFEEGQFNDDDINFVETWLAKSILKDPIAFAQNRAASDSAAVDNRPEPNGETSISYWIELLRDSKIYRCNNKSVFRSGDSIRFHMLPAADGYAYILMNRSSTGKQAVLFPDARTGLVNAVSSGQDYALPTRTWLKFDENPGLEEVTLLFSRKPIDSLKPDDARLASAYISPDRSGSKDLVPTRMQLSWDDPDPVIIPTGFSTTTESAQVVNAGTSNQSSLVKVTQQGVTDTLAVEIALAHM